jgi:hypothetical protein
MYNLFFTLLFIAIAAYYTQAMDTKHAVIILYLLVANVAEPYRTFAVYIRLNSLIHMCWMSIMLCWLFHQYDFDIASLFFFLCWELAVFQLTTYLDHEALENHDIVYFGLLPILFTLYRESRRLIVRLVE